MLHTSPVEIVPAIMPSALADLREKAALVAGLAPSVQLDVMDGLFVPSKSWPYTPGGDAEFRAVCSGAARLPQGDAFAYEVDLMVREPKRVIGAWLAAGASRIVVHLEGTDRLSEILAEIATRRAAAPSPALGIALGIETAVERIAPFAERIDFVQCMGIARIGFQGEPFDERVLEKIAEIRGRFPAILVSVDGGVSLETAPRLAAAGAGRLVAGSAVFARGDTGRALATLRAAVDNGEMPPL
jgi:ribulose-phosphate 3-epimerase